MSNMKTVTSAMATLGLGLGLGGCGISGVHNVAALNSTTAQGGTPFTRALTDEYRAEANDEAFVEAEWGDAGWFAERGLRAAAGGVVAPAQPGEMTGWHWSVPPSDRVAMLANARGQLMSTLDGGARERSPAQAAHLQRLYDCWVEEEAEGELNNACGPEFRRLIGGTPLAQTSQTYRVFFDWDRSNITAQGAEVVKQATAAVAQGGITKILVTGFTDSTGGNAYNQALSERRAVAVRSELIQDGIPEHTISVLGAGEGSQLVKTEDDIREAQNRRALIVLQK